MGHNIFLILIIFGLPLSIAGSLLGWSSLLMFAIYCLSIIALASFMGRATESLAIITGPRIGGLLNATFGNAVELIISIFSLKAGLIGIVLASLTGSVIGNLLLVTGASFFVGGLKYKRQKFNVFDARHNAGLMTFGVLLAFIIPEVFAGEIDADKQMVLSAGISIILILLYIAGLFFKLVTHRGVYSRQDDGQAFGEEEEVPEWGKWTAIIVLALSTLAVAYISENLVHTFETVGEQLGWTELFIGVIIVAIVGNAAEHASAIIFAVKNKLDVSVEIAVGSTLQVAMFVAPVLVLVSFLFEKQMPLVFTLPELVAMALSVLLMIVITNDGESNWFEGLTLLAAYVLMGLGFYLI